MALGGLGLSGMPVSAQNAPRPTTAAENVLPLAGTVAPHVTLTLTGDPVTPGFLRARIYAAVIAASSTGLAGGAVVQPAAILPLPEALESGFLTRFTVPVDITPAPGTLGVHGQTLVDVVNAGLPAFAPPRLSFRDDPERITADGVLSRTTVDISTPARLYYYHENRHDRRRFCVVLSANDSVISEVQIIDAAAGPNIDVMTVGHAVSKTFVALQSHNEGTVVQIRGGKPVLERDTPIGPGDGIVGALDLRVLMGGPVTATVMAIPARTEPAMYLYAPKLPDDGHGRHGRFDLTNFGQQVIAYTVGGRDVRYVYGRRQTTLPNTDPHDTGHDFGDYGVLQHVTFDLDNPLEAPATLYFYEKPLGGVVRSSFALNGAITDVGCVRVPQRYLVGSLTLAPRTTAAYDVVTMTDGGSNYPLEVGLTATPPTATTPPISAPDGCFPKPHPVTPPS